jgi:hypothetical protein
LIPWTFVALVAATNSTPLIQPVQPLQLAQVVVRERIIVRVPVRRGAAREVAQRIDWHEAGGPNCVPARSIAGAAMLSQRSVDLVMRNTRRLRAMLDESCPALDFYRGFYISPNPDGMICAGRDLIRSRMGGECGIDSFRSLKPVARD